MRKVSQPNTMPDAPTVIEYGAANSHTPTPDTTQMMPVTMRNRRVISTRKHSTAPGIRFASRCCQSPCSSGAHRMPSSPST